MRDITTVMKFTMKEMVKRKAFIVSTIIILVMIVIGFNVPNILKAIKGDNTGKNLLIVDSQNVFEGYLDNIKDIDTDYNIEIEQYNYEQIKQKINDKELDSAIIIENENGNLKLRYIVENKVMIEKIPEDIVSAISTIYSNLQISKLGLTEEQILTITPNLEFSIEQTSEKEVEGNIIAMMLMSLVLFYAIYFCAYQVSTSITTEKTSKIMETLVTSASPKAIILGKTIGMGFVGLVQMILIVGTALVSAKTFLDPELVNTVLNMDNMTLSLGIIAILYFVLGYLEFSLLFALTGSTVSKPEDIQSANSPVVFLTIIGFYLSYFTMMNPTSNLNVFASLLPISSPFCMPFRVMMGLTSTSDVAISIAILIATIFIIAKIAIKIYSSAILNYGTKLKLKDILKIYKQK